MGAAAIEPSPEPATTASASASLDSLREQGAQRFDPVRFVYLEALARRASQASGELQQVLQDKLDAAVASYAQLAVQHQVERGPARSGHGVAATEKPLAALNLHIRAATATTATDAGNYQLPRDGGRTELKSARRFREVWSRIAAADQVDQAIGRGPENAGPLNSHMLVLRSLALMQKLSPDYLRRFLSHVDTLLWLDEDAHRQVSADVKPVRRNRPKK
ncbi:MAG: DUF2894 domain-containing protein [Comamonadaceae bacterium]|nr:MAG: DUF2894 domain-containing protein [Comamonadaceae bacterium]